MRQLFISSRAVVPLTIVGIIAVANLASLSSQGLEPQDDCIRFANLAEERIPQTQNEAVNRALQESAHNRVKDEIRRRRQQSHHARVAEMAKWRGTNVFVSEQASRETPELAEQVARAFRADPPSPEARNGLFSDFLDDNSAIKCVGWDASVDRAIPREGGEHEVIVYVRPVLTSTKWLHIHTPQVSIEKWQFSNGALHFVEARDSGMRGLGAD